MKLNCDMGEGLASDADVMPYLQQANIACGGHTGTTQSMRQTVRLAVDNDVSIGAHPAYPDPDNFGRQSLKIEPKLLSISLTKQLVDLAAVCRELNTHIDYVKPHGALNNDMVQHDDLFNTICQTISEYQSGLTIMVQMTARKDELQAIASKHDLPVIWEIFADRAYEADGTLRNRQYADAVHQTPRQIVQQVAEIEANQRVPIHDSNDYYDIKGASSMCIHGDNAASVAACPQIAQILARHGNE